MNPVLERFSSEVPELDDDNPICWVKFLEQHSKRARRVARAVVEMYDGQGAKLAAILGVSPQTINLHLRHPVVRYMLGERKGMVSIEGAIADREERAETLTMIMRNDQLDLKDRMRALELLGKMHADYTDKLEVKGEITTLHELVASLAIEPPPRSGLEYAPHTAPTEVERSVERDPIAPHDPDPLQEMMT